MWVMMMKMTQEQWNELRYPVEVQQLADDEGGGWMAWIPLLGQGLFLAEGDTAAEALEELETLRRSLYRTVVDSGQPIRLPDDVTARPAASGKWLMRTSPRFHQSLKEEAEREGVSFNSYCEMLLLRGQMMGSAESAMLGLADKIASQATEQPRLAIGEVDLAKHPNLTRARRV